MGVTVNILEELRLRLQTSIDSGTLNGKINKITMGSFDDARTEGEYPIINILLGDGEEKPVAMRHTFVKGLAINIQLLANTLKDDEGNPGNSLYKISDSTGIAFLIDEVMDVIDKNTSGVPDLVFAGTADNLRQYPFITNYHLGFVEIITTLLVDTKKFLAGSR